MEFVNKYSSILSIFRFLYNEIIYHLDYKYIDKCFHFPLNIIMDKLNVEIIRENRFQSVIVKSHFILGLSIFYQTTSSLKFKNMLNIIDSIITNLQLIFCFFFIFG